MEYEEKFIVINKKRLQELNEVCGKGRWFPIADAVSDLEDAINHFVESYEANVDKKLNQKYYVVNQDEPYASEVFKIISQGEDAKPPKQD